MRMPEPIRLADETLWPPVFLAPMAGITDLPFRRAVARHGGAGLMVSEMVASTEMVTPRPSTRAAVRTKALTEGTGPVSVQIAGREADAMAETARIGRTLGWKSGGRTALGISSVISIRSLGRRVGSATGTVERSLRV